MEMRPPCVVICEQFAKTLVTHRSTHEAVVLTADSVSIARTAASTDDADGRAGEADVGDHTLKDDAKQAKKSGHAGGAGLFTAHIVSQFTTIAAYERTYGFNAVAALDGAGRAGPGPSLSRAGSGDSDSLGGFAAALVSKGGWGGDCKDRYEGNGSNGGKAREHLENTEESLGYLGLFWCIWKMMLSPLVLHRLI